MQTRPYDWFDVKKHKMMFGLEVKHFGRWMVVGIKGRPLLFETEKEREEERAKCRKLKQNTVESSASRSGDA